MSGLEGIAVLGLACNVLQVINVAQDSISTLRNVIKSSNPDPTLVESSTHLRSKAQDIKEQFSCKSRPMTQADRDLVEVAGGCIKASEDLLAMIEEVSVPKGQRPLPRQAASRAIKATFFKGKIQSLERDLLRWQRSERTMDTYLLAQIANRNRQEEVFGSQLREMASVLSKDHQTVFAEHTPSASKSSMEKSLLHNVDHMGGDTTSQRQHDHLLASLKFPEMNARANQIESKHSGTFSWVFNAESGRQHCFPGWLESTGDLYWIVGKPASGKSTLIKYLVTAPETQQALERWHPETKLLSHAFWSPGSPMQKDIRGLLASLLHQLFVNSKTLALRLLRNDQNLLRKDFISDWSTCELKHLLMQCLEDVKVRSCIFIDGLDEVNDLEDVLELVDELTSLPNVKLCVSSRPERFEKLARLGMQDHTAKDIGKYVHDKLFKHTPRCPFRVTLIARSIVRKAPRWCVSVGGACDQES